MSERKPDDERRNRNPRVYPTRFLKKDGVVRGPELPSHIKWSAETTKWWVMVRGSAQAQLMHESDWEQMLIAATLHNAMFSEKLVWSKSAQDMVEAQPSASELKALSSEFRAYTATYGFTHQDRVKYGINIVDEDDIVAEATSATLRESEKAKAQVDYRKTLGKR